jgi:hypothetical protein
LGEALGLALGEVLGEVLGNALGGVLGPVLGEVLGEVLALADFADLLDKGAFVLAEKMFGLALRSRLMWLIGALENCGVLFA